jgi:hypothetical protein
MAVNRGAVILGCDPKEALGERDVAEASIAQGRPEIDDWLVGKMFLDMVVFVAKAKEIVIMVRDVIELLKCGYCEVGGVVLHFVWQVTKLVSYACFATDSVSPHVREETLEPHQLMLVQVLQYLTYCSTSTTCRSLMLLF